MPTQRYPSIHWPPPGAPPEPLAPPSMRYSTIRNGGHSARCGLQVITPPMTHRWAVAAAHALATHPIERIAIIDFDVHHGNGTADIFANDVRVMYASTHQSPLYPGTGGVSQRGVGNLIHVPLAPGAGSHEFREAFVSRILPQLDRFAPQLVLISAGFDAHRLDPLANLNLESDDYAWVTTELVAIAERHAGGRVISSLEGGYSLRALHESTIAHINALA